MSFDEKGIWAFVGIGLATFIGYAVVILRRADGGPLTDVNYAPVLLWAIGIAVLASILATIAVAISKPSEADKRDVRDKEINRFGEYVGGSVLGFGMILPLALAMLDADHFWIANSIYLIALVSTMIGAAVKLVTYRRGL
jgi:hypothetical protein